MTSWTILNMQLYDLIPLSEEDYINIVLETIFYQEDCINISWTKYSRQWNCVADLNLKPDGLVPLSITRNNVCIPRCWESPTSDSRSQRPGLDGHICRVANPPEEMKNKHKNHIKFVCGGDATCFHKWIPINKYKLSLESYIITRVLYLDMRIYHVHLQSR